MNEFFDDIVFEATIPAKKLSRVRRKPPRFAVTPIASSNPPPHSALASFHAELETYRLLAGHSKQHLSFALGYSHAYWSVMLDQQQILSKTALLAFCDYYQIIGNAKVRLLSQRQRLYDARLAKNKGVWHCPMCQTPHTV